MSMILFDPLQALRAVELIHPRQAEVFRWRCFEGLTFAEIGDRPTEIDLSLANPMTKRTVGKSAAQVIFFLAVRRLVRWYRLLENGG